MVYKGLYKRKANGPKIVEIVRDVVANSSLCGNVKSLDIKGDRNAYRDNRSVDLIDAKCIALISNGNR